MHFVSSLLGVPLVVQVSIRLLQSESEALGCQATTKESRMQQAAWAAAARMAQEAGPTASTARVPCPSACRSRLAGWPVGIFSALPRAPPRPLLLAFLPAFPPAPGAPIHRLSQRITMPPTAPRPCDPSCCRRRRSLCAIALCGLALCHGAQAEPYPARSVEIIVPWAVGGGSDAVARAFADAATRLTGQSFVVINRPGASGAIGHHEGAAARPDGYKLTMVTPEVSLAYLQGIGKTQWSDFQYVARINIDPIALVVKADAPWSTLEQFTDYARSHPGLASISNSGVGATYHLAAIALEKKTGLSFNNVPYIGAAPAVMGLLSGQVDAALATTGEVGVHVKGGKLRMLGVMSERRLKDFDQVPTFHERQIDVQLATWRALAAPQATPAPPLSTHPPPSHEGQSVVQRAPGRALAAPKATPAPVLATLRQLVDKVTQDSAYRHFFARQFLGLVNEDGVGLRARLDRESAFYTEAVNKLQLAK